MPACDRPTPPIDPLTERWQAPLSTVWSAGPRDTRPTDERGRLVLDDAQLSATYTCMSCNKGWALGDPGFVHYRFGPAGSPTEGMVVGSLGWFSHCADKDACAHRRTNVHSGQHPEALTLADELPALASAFA